MRLPVQKKQEAWVWSLSQKDPLEKERAAHSSILSWKIPSTHTHTHTHTTHLNVCVVSSQDSPMCCAWSLSRAWLFATFQTVAHQAPLPMGFSRQEYWSGLPCPPPGDLPNPGIVPRSPTLQADSLPSEPPGKPLLCARYCCKYKCTSSLFSF